MAAAAAAADAVPLPNELREDATLIRLLFCANDDLGESKRLMSLLRAFKTGREPPLLLLLLVWDALRRRWAFSDIYVTFKGAVCKKL